MVNQFYSRKLLIKIDTKNGIKIKIVPVKSAVIKWESFS